MTAQSRLPHDGLASTDHLTFAERSVCDMSLWRAVIQVLAQNLVPKVDLVGDRRKPHQTREYVPFSKIETATTCKVAAVASGQIGSRAVYRPSGSLHLSHDVRQHGSPLCAQMLGIARMTEPLFSATIRLILDPRLTRNSSEREQQVNSLLEQLIRLHLVSDAPALAHSLIRAWPTEPILLTHAEFPSKSEVEDYLVHTVSLLNSDQIMFGLAESLINQYGFITLDMLEVIKQHYRIILTLNEDSTVKPVLRAHTIERRQDTVFLALEHLLDHFIRVDQLSRDPELSDLKIMGSSLMATNPAFYWAEEVISHLWQQQFIDGVLMLVDRNCCFRTTVEAIRNSLAQQNQNLPLLLLPFSSDSDEPGNIATQINSLLQMLHLHQEGVTI
jgi:hypothetical protein